MQCFEKHMEQAGQVLVRDSLSCLQMNVGYACNLHCNHCHLAAGPDRREEMGLSVIKDCVEFIERVGVKVVDITGGAPEMNSHLPDLIRRLRKIPHIESILLRSNLTILEKKQYAYFIEFFREYHVDIIASLPCYTEENVELQRGKGVYASSISILQKLNQLGYGREQSAPKLNLVYNPGGATLPGLQGELETAYKEILSEKFGITFNHLYTITNAPIGRFRDSLIKEAKLNDYLKIQADHFNPDNLTKVMCRNQVSVDWNGHLYDCDFNQALKLQLPGDPLIGRVEAHQLIGQPIVIGEQCLTCVAGAGSSCQGCLEPKAG